ncbi:MAG: hypothetical protein KDK24_19125 [Pseudooceanicola sp.]|nr:hypothetical protein [Pseudooceanicola sp.]
MSRMLGFALTLDTADAWQGFAFVALTRMSEAERVALAFWALTTLDDDTAYLTASAALFGMGDEVAA